MRSVLLTLNSLLLSILFSCQNNTELEGSWLYQTKLNDSKKLHNGDSLFQYYYNNYNHLTFEGNKVTSVEKGLLIIEKGTFKIVGDSLVIQIGDWLEKSKITLSGDSLTLTRMIDERPCTFSYFKSDPYIEDTMFKSKLGENYFNPAVYIGFDWEFTGESYETDNGVESPIKNNLPEYFSFRLNQQESFSFNKCMFDYKDGESNFSAYIHKYDGTEMHISSNRWSGSFDLLSNTVYVYRRKR